MSKVTNIFTDEVFIRCANSKKGELPPHIPPRGGERDDLPMVGGSEGYLTLQAIKIVKGKRTPQHSKIISISTDRDEYDAICTYNSSSCIWTIGAKLKDNGSHMINRDIRIQTNVNVEIGP
jgi:hypothetical protein